MIDKELVEQWVDEAIDKYMTQDAHFMYVANAAAAHGAAQRDAELMGDVELPEPDGKVAHEARAYEPEWISSEDAYSEGTVRTLIAAARLQERRDYIEKCAELEIVHDAYGERITALENSLMNAGMIIERLTNRLNQQ